MKKNLVFIKLFLSLVFCLSATAFAQETTGGLEGYVKDPAGAVVPNVTVTVTSASETASGTTTTGAGAGFRRTITTNEEGFFRLLQVPPGTYNVVTSPTGGFAEARYENVTVAIGRNTQLDITVNPGTNVTTVDVSTADAPPVDTTDTSIQTTINAQKIELLPKSTGFTSLLRTVPGTRPESRSGGFSVDGASGGENVFVIDGQEVTNYRTGTLNETYNIPTQLVQEVQVKTSGFDAAYGGATGGVISVATRGGNNDFHGEFGLQFETPELNGNPRPLLTRFATGTVGSTSNPFVQTAEYFNPAKAGGVNFFPTSNLSGPIIKNKLWFYGSYSPQIYGTELETLYYTNAPAATRTFVTSERYSRKRTYEYAFARLDANPFNNLRLTGTYLWNPVVDKGGLGTAQGFSNVGSNAISFGAVPTANFGGNIGILRGRELTSRQGGRQNSNVVTVSGVYTPTSNLVVDGRFSRGFLNEKLGNYFVPQLVQIADCGSPAPPASFQCATTPANSVTVKDVSIRTSYEFSATYIFNALGRHELRGGYQRYTIFNDVQSGNNAIGQLRFNYGVPISTLQPGVTPTPGAIGSGSFRRTGTNGQGRNLSQGIFIQDKYQPINRLTLNLGIRIEKEDLPSFNQYPSAVNFDWTDKIAPRLGFAYDITGDGKTRLFASYGKFYDRVKFALPRGLFGGDIFLEDYFEIFPGETAGMFNINNIVGNFTGSSTCPSTGFITANARSRCQRNLRVNANEPGASPYTSGAVDPNLDPFQQTEFTVGAERQLSRNYVLRVRYTFKNVNEAVEDAGIVNAQGSEAYIIGNPGKGLHLETLQALGYNMSIRPQRRYDGLEFVLEKRLSNNWYFNANYTYSRLFGNYTGLASSDEPHLVEGRLAPGVSRAFDLPFIGFTAEGQPDNGPLPTDRPHVFNIYGAYIFDWMGSRSNSTEISAFQTVTSGTPMTTSIYGQSSVTPQIFYRRGDLGRTPTFSQTDFNITHRYRFGRDDRFTMAFDLNVLNLLDQDTVTGIYQTMNTTTGRPNDAAMFPSAPSAQRPRLYANAYISGALLEPIRAHIAASPDRPDIRYGMPQLFQGPRTVRFGFRFLF
ncbi:MAG: carboxypeptidase regulatory-like domain-containing protein [Acidobacteriota bacterium]|nr:carboxypeptidase regulatory-like domain-containing protein [Acidobacteriota bacterium]